MTCFLSLSIIIKRPNLRRYNLDLVVDFLKLLMIILEAYMNIIQQIQDQDQDLE